MRHIHVGKRPKSASAWTASSSRLVAAYVAVDAVRVGPVGLNGDGGESLLGDQPPRDECPLAVELVGAVRRFAEQHDARVANVFEKGVILCWIAIEAARVCAHDVEHIALGPCRRARVVPMSG